MNTIRQALHTKATELNQPGDMVKEYIEEAISAEGPEYFVDHTKEQIVADFVVFCREMSDLGKE
jgi:hypothetical protein